MKRIVIAIAAALILVAAFLFGGFVWLTDSYIDQRYSAVLAQMSAEPLPELLSNGIRMRMGDLLALQLARECFYPPSRTLGRRLRELLVSYRLRQRFSESELLSLYGHTVSLGHGDSGEVVGFKSAAQTYFGKNLSDLTAAEAAWLAVFATRPNYYLRHPDHAREARDTLLRQMSERHLISASEEERAEAEPVPPARSAPLR